jgi:hypothetical protein
VDEKLQRHVELDWVRRMKKTATGEEYRQLRAQEIALWEKIMDDMVADGQLVAAGLDAKGRKTYALPRAKNGTSARKA